MAKDVPLDECIRRGSVMIAAGHLVFQKFTCAGCGNRLTMDIPNQFFDSGTCDNCPATTDIKKQGCGFTLVTNLTVEQYEKMQRRQG